MQSVRSKIAKTVHSVAKKHLGSEPDAGGGKTFVHPSEWDGEYGKESLLIIVHDGGDYAKYFNMDYQDYEAIELMSKALDKLGVFVQDCEGWYSAVYESEPSDSPELSA